jgi:hypothetical protein
VGFGLWRRGFAFGGALVVAVAAAVVAGDAVVAGLAGGADDLWPEHAASADAAATTTSVAVPRSRIRRVRLTACLF